jgi:hypothetical protein
MQQLVPNYVASKTLDGLRGLMAQVSVKLNGTVTFFSVYYDGKQHVAWFHDKPENVISELRSRAKDARK